MRGGTVVNRPSYARPGGLSPHARGNPLAIGLPDTGRGPIPACAGEPRSVYSNDTLAGAYPRMRGGTMASMCWGLTGRGLSPHARGNPPSPFVQTHLLGPIPACAGEPCSETSHPLSRRAYPRMRGGTFATAFRYLKIRGLSPHARGNPAGTASGDGYEGPIPACAGEPQRGGRQHKCGRAYPRMRGGTRGVGLCGHPSWGLSPHARGNHAGSVLGGNSPGPIPACAGEPCTCATTMLASRAYPRMRGGTIDLSNNPCVVRGLSPHARGNRMGAGEAPTPSGPIPACAGEPTYQRLPCGVSRAYPRMRGGTYTPVTVPVASPGLSPHARGNPPHAWAERRWSGPIPACAGEPAIDGL